MRGRWRVERVRRVFSFQYTHCANNQRDFLAHTAVGYTQPSKCSPCHGAAQNETFLCATVASLNHVLSSRAFGSLSVNTNSRSCVVCPSVRASPNVTLTPTASWPCRSSARSNPNVETPSSAQAQLPTGRCGWNFCPLSSSENSWRGSGGHGRGSAGAGGRLSRACALGRIG